MRDVEVAAVAGRQFNRIARWQLLELGFDDKEIWRRTSTRRLIAVEEGVFAVTPLLHHDPWGKWMGATLTAPATSLSHQSAAAAWGFWTLPRSFETVTRPGSGGKRRHGGLLVYRSNELDGDCTTRHGVPITTVPRTLLDLARVTSNRALARAVRESVRLELVTLSAIGNALERHRGRRGAGRLGETIARYSGLPVERARSGAEVRAMQILREAGRPLPRLNHRIAGEEADLSWSDLRLIIEIDGGPFHLDVGEDARKQAAWEAAGWQVRRLSADDVYEFPQRLLFLARPNVPQLGMEAVLRDVRAEAAGG
jgi:hypothetical protein